MNSLRRISRFIIPYKPRCRLCINTRNIVPHFFLIRLLLSPNLHALCAPVLYRPAFKSKKEMAMTRGMSNDFERLVQTDSQLACQFQFMTQERIREFRSLTFGGVSPARLSDEEVYQFGLDYFAAIKHGRKPEDILRDIGAFAAERGVTFNQPLIESEIGTLSAMFARDGFRKNLDDASRATGAAKECLLM